MRWLPLVFTIGCSAQPLVFGDFELSLNEDGTFDLTHATVGEVAESVALLGGSVSAEVDMQFGAFRFEEVAADRVRPGGFGKIHGRRSPIPVLEIEDRKGELLGYLTVAGGGDTLLLDWAPEQGRNTAGDGSFSSGLAGLAADCDKLDHFMGLGAHAQDVDHVGEAFSLWVQEPGIGKSTDDALPPGWPMEGARHDTSFPVPAWVRPQRGQGWVMETTGRVDLDLCATDPGRFEALAWDSGPIRVAVFANTTALGATEQIALHQGTGALPPPWTFGPWNDAIRGRDRVEEVAARLRDFGVSSTAIWTEDWKGGEENAFGYHLKGEWSVDEALYPDAAGLAAELEGQGFHWLAYFSPFLMEGTDAWQEALDAGVMIEDPSGEPYTFTGATFKTTSMVDLSTAAGQDWAIERMQAALDLGFDGWMADFAEWLPVDTALSGRDDALHLHNAFPLMWQEANANAVAGTDAVFFVRSGWLGTPGMVPVVWAGDQRTSFDVDDGYPTVLAMGLGMSASGVGVFTHDIAGYQSVGNDPTDRELWYRWASLGAWSPVMRTHHGAYDLENWQFDTDDATTEHWAAVADVHGRLFPYLYGLAAQSQARGTPMILPVPYVYGGDWGRTDAWLLGQGVLVAPVLERGVDGRQVELPGDVRWWRFPELTPAQTGFHTATQEQIPVFVAEGTTLPMLVEAPETWVTSDAVDASLRTLADADAARIVYLLGGGGPFTEADGTTYTPSGVPTGAAEVTVTLMAGEIEVGGVRVDLAGSVERSYTFVVVD